MKLKPWAAERLVKELESHADALKEAADCVTSNTAEELNERREFVLSVIEGLK